MRELAAEHLVALIEGREAALDEVRVGPGLIPRESTGPGRAEGAVAASRAMVTAGPGRAAGSSHRAKPKPKPTASPSAGSISAVPSASSSGMSGAPPVASAPVTSVPAPAKSGSAPASAPASAPSSEDGAAAAQVLALINQARAKAGLPALTITSGLETSSSQHNLLMAGGCGLSHQCAGEPAIGDRETAAGVHWTAAGENIGEGGPVSGTSAAIAQMAVGLTQSMLNEQPPDDGHRMNILSSSYTHIGIAVDRDSSGTVWLTQDFSN